jgi:hypothetical protein
LLAKQEIEKRHFGIESIKMISIEPYLRVQEPQDNADKPSVHFVVNLDIVPNMYGSWGKGINGRYVGVVKEQGVWKINALTTTSRIRELTTCTVLNGKKVTTSWKLNNDEC